MEKAYKILKILIVVLAIAIVIVLGSRILGHSTPTVPVETTAATESASTAPDFTVYDIDGNPVKLSDFRGQPVILNFWASWCGPCKAEMPDFEEAFLHYGDQIAFVTVNLTDGRNETVETASSFIAQQGYTFPVYYDTELQATYAYGINAIPATYFIDAEGSIVSHNPGMIRADALQQNIDALLNVE